MYTQLAERLAIRPIDWSTWLNGEMEPPAFTFVHSKAVDMADGNAVRYDAVAFAFDRGGSSTTPKGEVWIDLQGSNDQENWLTIVEADSGGITIDDEGFYRSDLVMGVCFAFVRLQYRCWQASSEFGGGVAYCVLGAGLDVSKQ